MDSSISDEVKKKGLQVCQNYVGGSWASLCAENFCMEYVHGGLSNLLYICSVTDKVITKPSEPRKVMVRLFGQIIGTNPEVVIVDQVVFALLAEKGFVPKLYGIFTNGRVEEYVESRCLVSSELRRADISAACARVLAGIHTIDMPLNKQPSWLFDIMTRYLNEALNNVSIESAAPEKRLKYAKLFAPDLEKELAFLKDILLRVSSPVVFSHNDLQAGNILFSPNEKSWHLIPIDFEYASYNYRGFDLGNHFCEWCYDYKVAEYPHFAAHLEYYPSREQQFNFFRAYLQSNGRDGEASDHDLEHMMLEANTFALASHFMWALWSTIQAQISSIKFGYLEYAQARFDAYFQQKKQVLAALHINSFSK